MSFVTQHDSSSDPLLVCHLHWHLQIIHTASCAERVTKLTEGNAYFKSTSDWHWHGMLYNRTDKPIPEPIHTKHVTVAAKKHTVKTTQNHCQQLSCLVGVCELLHPFHFSPLGTLQLCTKSVLSTLPQWADVEQNKGRWHPVNADKQTHSKSFTCFFPH